MYINITATILDIIHRSAFYLKHRMDNYRTSQEAHYVSATEPNPLMRSIGLWQWYINIPITILNIIHCPVFYLKQKMDNVRTALEIHYFSATEPNRLMRTTGLWRWYINTTVRIPNIIHRHVFYLKCTTNVRTSQETLYVSIKSPKG
jgi:hypothetical protein